MDISANWFKDKKVTVMGLGLHGGGLGISKWLLRRGARLTVTDMKDAKQLKHSVSDLDAEYRRCKLRPPFGIKPHKPKLALGKHRDDDFKQADMVIRNPAVPNGNPFIARAEKVGIMVESDISLFFHLCPFPIAAVTGTKGKTTTTALLADICKRHDKRSVVGGNIRISPMDSLDDLLKMAEGYRRRLPPPVVLELSSWQLESLEKHQVSAKVAVVTNVMRDHLNRYDGRISAYAAAKELNVRFQGPGDTAVMNHDDPRVEAMARRLERKGKLAPRVVRFSRQPYHEGPACFVEKGMIVLKTDGTERLLFPIKELRVPGEHNIPNVLAAVAAADALGVTPDVIVAGVSSFHGVIGRLEKVDMKSGVTYINDTTATTPDASIAALKAFSGPGRKRSIVLIAGGADKDLHFADWAQAVKKHAKAVVLLSGSATPRMISALKRAGSRQPYRLVESMKEAVAAAVEAASARDKVILSPGCASFGLFVNEFDRGDQFAKAVRRL